MRDDVDLDGLENEPVVVSSRLKRKQDLDAKRKVRDRHAAENAREKRARKEDAMFEKERKKNRRASLMSELADVNLKSDTLQLLQSSSRLGGGSVGRSFHAKQQKVDANSRRKAESGDKQRASQTNSKKKNKDVKKNDESCAKTPENDSTLDEDVLKSVDRSDDTEQKPNGLNGGLQRTSNDSEIDGNHVELPVVKDEEPKLPANSYLAAVDVSGIKRTARVRRPRVIKASRKEASEMMNGGSAQNGAIGKAPMTYEEFMNGPLRDVLLRAINGKDSDESKGSNDAESGEEDDEDSDEDSEDCFEDEMDDSEQDKDDDDGGIDESVQESVKKRALNAVEKNAISFDLSSDDEESSCESKDEDESKRKEEMLAGKDAVVIQQNQVRSSKQRSSKEPVERSFYVKVERSEEIERSRMELPVCEKEQEIMEAIYENDVVFVGGATGSGKTTQVPQFLFEAGFGDKEHRKYQGMVAVAQPRRVAAISCATRVAEELNVKIGQEVGFHVRHYARFSDDTRVKFVTDGVLLREVEHDLLLRKYSVIILDEVHERSLNLDLLITLISRSVRLRRARFENDAQDSIDRIGPLKLVIMSATLDTTVLLEGASSPFAGVDVPCVSAESRQFPVTCHFSRRTESNYMEQAFEKVKKIHKRLPAGHVLVFVTGQAEVHQLTKRLQESELGHGASYSEDAQVVGLYGMLPEDKQRLVFEKCKTSTKSRVIVVATNVAETSVTLAGIVYVVDSGRVKDRLYRPHASGIVLSAFEIDWTSKSSANQRAGRAGRTAPGHCYRLYSAAIYQNEFPDSVLPEVLRVPCDSLILRLNVLGITDVTKFPLPTRPSESAITQACAVLRKIGAVDASGRITQIGRSLARFPLPPRVSRMLLASYDDHCEQYAARMAAILAVGELFVNEMKTKSEDGKSEPSHRGFMSARSELLSRLKALCAAEHEMNRSNGSRQHFDQFCHNHGLHSRSVVEALQITKQLESEIHCSQNFTDKRDGLEPFTDSQASVLIKAFLSAFPDQVARRLSREEAIAFTSGMQGPKRLRFAYTTPSFPGKAVYLSSEAFSEEAHSDPEFICFNELVIDHRRGDTMMMRNATIVHRKWIASICSGMCSYSEPLESPKPRYRSDLDAVMCRARAFYSESRWNLGVVEVPFPETLTSWSSAISTGGLNLVRYRIFGRALLEGEVIPDLSAYESQLLHPASSIETLFGAPRISIFVSLLARHRISSRSTLLQQLHLDKSFLLHDLLTWYPSQLHNSIAIIWHSLASSSIATFNTDDDLDNHFPLHSHTDPDIQSE